MSRREGDGPALDATQRLVWDLISAPEGAASGEAALRERRGLPASGVAALIEGDDALPALVRQRLRSGFPLESRGSLEQHLGRALVHGHRATAQPGVHLLRDKEGRKIWTRTTCRRRYRLRAYAANLPPIPPRSKAEPRPPRNPGIYG